MKALIHIFFEKHDQLCFSFCTQYTFYTMHESRSPSKFLSTVRHYLYCILLLYTAAAVYTIFTVYCCCCCTCSTSGLHISALMWTTRNEQQTPGNKTPECIKGKETHRKSANRKDLLLCTHATNYHSVN